MKMLILENCVPCPYNMGRVCHTHRAAGTRTTRVIQELPNYPDIPDWCPLDEYEDQQKMLDALVEELRDKKKTLDSLSHCLSEAERTTRTVPRRK